MIAPARLLEAEPPDFVRVLCIRRLTRTFARALGVGAPSLRGLSAEQALDAFCAFTARTAEAALRGERAEELGARLNEHAYRLGKRMRILLAVRSCDAFATLRFFYRCIGIRLAPHGALPGTLTFERCAFAQSYRPAVCGFMAAFDDGFACGLANLPAGSLSFDARITEGATCCRAQVRGENA